MVHVLRALPYFDFCILWCGGRWCLWCGATVWCRGAGCRRWWCSSGRGQRGGRRRRGGLCRWGRGGGCCRGNGWCCGNRQCRRGTYRRCGDGIIVGLSFVPIMSVKDYHRLYVGRGIQQCVWDICKENKNRLNTDNQNVKRYTSFDYYKVPSSS